MKIKRYGLVVILVLSLFAASCYRREVGREPEQDIFVFAPASVWNALQKPLEDAFSAGIETPQPEKYFRLKYIPNPDDLDKYTLHRNLMFVATLDSKGPIADLVRKSISSPETMAGVKEGKNFLFKKENQWVEDQTILLLVSVNTDSLAKKIEAFKQQIFSIYNSHYVKQLTKEMFASHENKKLEEEFLNKYQWTIRIQHDYFLAWESPDTGFVFLRRMYPERWLYVRWIETDNPSLINKDWIVNERDSVGTWFYGGDTVNRKYVKFNVINFNGRRAYQVDGLWENNKKVAGGPFREYVFYDEPTSRIYIIDCAVFDPKDLYGKMPYMRQLDVIARSFKTLVDIQKGK